MDAIATCRTCAEAALEFGIAEWIGMGVLVAAGLVSFFTKKNIFSMSVGLFEVGKSTVEKLRQK